MTIGDRSPTKGRSAPVTTPPPARLAARPPAPRRLLALASDRPDRRRPPRAAKRAGQADRRARPPGHRPRGRGDQRRRREDQRPAHCEVHRADDRGTAATRPCAGSPSPGPSPSSAASPASGPGGIARAARNPSGVPLVTPSPLPAPLAAETAFSTCPPPAHQGKVLGPLAANEELKAKRVAVLLDARSGLCAGVTDAFVRKFNANGERQADQFRYESDAGLADLAARAAKAEPDAVLMATRVTDFVKLREGLAKAEVKGPMLFGGEESAWPALLAEADAGRGVYAVTTFAADGLTRHGQEFAKKYQGAVAGSATCPPAASSTAPGCCSRPCAGRSRASRSQYAKRSSIGELRQPDRPADHRPGRPRRPPAGVRRPATGGAAEVGQRLRREPTLIRDPDDAVRFVAAFARTRVGPTRVLANAATQPTGHHQPERA